MNLRSAGRSIPGQPVLPDLPVLALTFTSNQYLPQSYPMRYGLLRWATKGGRLLPELGDAARAG